MRPRTLYTTNILLLATFALALAPQASAGPVCPPQDHTDPTGMFHVTVDQWGCNITIVVLEAGDCLDPWHHSSGLHHPTLTIWLMPRCDTTPPPNHFPIDPIYNTLQTACDNAIRPGACTASYTGPVCKEIHRTDPTGQIHIDSNPWSCQYFITIFPTADCAPPLRHTTYHAIANTLFLSIPGCGVRAP